MSDQPINIEQLEQLVKGLSWETVSLEPDAAEISVIDEVIPQEWTAILESALEQEIEREVLEPLYAMDIHELNGILNIPEGDIVTNARESLDTFEIDTEVIMQEVEKIDITIDQEITIEHDNFGR